MLTTTTVRLFHPLALLLLASLGQLGSPFNNHCLSWPATHNIIRTRPQPLKVLNNEYNSFHPRFSIRDSPFTTTSTTSSSTSALCMAAAEPGGSSNGKSSLPFWLDPGTRGGAVFLSILLFLFPLVGYSIVTNVFGVDATEAGKWIGVGFTAIATLLWVGTYIFRVATKDMTYVRIYCVYTFFMLLISAIKSPCFLSIDLEWPRL